MAQSVHAQVRKEACVGGIFGARRVEMSSVLIDASVLIDVMVVSGKRSR